MKYGYVRVSAVDQNIARQKIHKKNIYVDKQSGKNFNNMKNKYLFY